MIEQLIEQLLVLFIIIGGLVVMVGGPSAGQRYLAGAWRTLFARPFNAILRWTSRQLWRGVNAFWRWLVPRLGRAVYLSAVRVRRAFVNVCRALVGLA